MNLFLFFLILFSFELYAFEFQILKEQIERKKPSTLEEVLDLLPLELRSNFLLLYNSRSLQDSTPEEPRAILYSSQGDFFLSFNGTEDQKGGTYLEVLEKKPGGSGQFFRITFKDRKPVFEVNPPLCFTCHSAFGHPLWDPTRIWPGVYGSVGPENSFLLPPNEASNFQNFIERQREHQRYKFLNLNGVTYESLYFRNLSFTDLIYKLEAERLAQFVLQNLKSIPLAAWLSSKRGDAFIDELPLELREKAQKSYQIAIPYLCKRILTNSARRLKRQLTEAGLSSLPSFLSSGLTSLEALTRAYVLTDVGGVLDEFKELSSLTLERESYLSQDGSLGFWGHFYKALGKRLELFSGTEASLTREGETFTLLVPHPQCGSFQWP